MEPLTIGAGLYLAGASLYNAWQSYQTQQREDNAVQRRVADLQKAGLSPTLAAGSSAQATATPGVNPNNFGAWIDAQNALEQLKQNREYTKQARIATSEANRQNNLSKMAYMYNLGFAPVDYWYNSNDSQDNDFVSYDPGYIFGSKVGGREGEFWRPGDFANSPLMQRLRGGQQVYNNEVEASNIGLDLSRKENSWYNFNQGLNAVTDVVGLGLDAFSTFGSFGLKRRALNQSFGQFQQEINRRQNYDNWRMNGEHGSYTTYGRGYRNTRYW